MRRLIESEAILKKLKQSEEEGLILDTQTLSGSIFNIKKYQKSSPEQRYEMLKNLIIKWRRISLHPKVEPRIDDIIDEAIATDERKKVRLFLDDFEEYYEGKDKKTRISMYEDAFNHILWALNFRNNAHELFRRWYIDGRLYLYVNEKIGQGITEVFVLDPLKLKLKKQGKKLFYEYVLEESFDELGIKQDNVLKIPYNEVVFIPSGLKNEHGIYISYLNKAVRYVDMLSLMENSMVIHRFVRAPERWVFKVDVSNMNPKKAREYMERLMRQYRSRFHIDPITGELKSENYILAMQENFFLPKTNSSGGGHDIETIGGGQSFSDIDDVLYWDKKVDMALNSPEEFDQEAIFNFGSNLDEVTRKEYRWFRFIRKIRSYFNKIFVELMYRQIKNMGEMNITPEDFYDDAKYFIFEYASDSVYAEAMKRSKIEMKFELLDSIEDKALEYYSKDWIRKEILKQTDEEIRQYEEERKKEGGDEQSEEEE